MADQIYFTDGDFYQCVAVTVPGESPTSAPTKWRKIRLLPKWRYAVAQLAYANLLRVDGQNDKAQIERKAAYDRERVGLDDLIRAEAHEEEKRRCHNRPGMAHPGAGHGGYVKASVILDDAYRLINWDAAQIDARDKADGRFALSQAVQEVWESWWWSQLMICSRVQFGPNVNRDSPTVPQWTIYSPSLDKYYTSLTEVSVYSGPDEEGGQNFPYYEVYVPNRGELTAWSSVTAYAALVQFSYAGVNYQTTQDAPAGTLPTDTTYFLPLTDWVPTLPSMEEGLNPFGYGPYGPIRGVSRFDPRTAANPDFFQLDVIADATRVIGVDVTHPWAWSRRVTPILTGDDFDTATIYEATHHTQLVFDT